MLLMHSARWAATTCVALLLAACGGGDSGGGTDPTVTPSNSTQLGTASRLNSAACETSSALACAGDDGTQSKPASATPVGRTTIEWVDGKRPERCGAEAVGAARRLQATVWYPAKPAQGARPSPLLSQQQIELLAAQGIDPALLQGLPSRSHDEAPLQPSRERYPVLLMSHGAGGDSPLSHSDTAESLAARGFVVVGLSHTYNALATFFADGSVRLADPACDPGGVQPAITDTSGYADLTANWLASVELDAYFSADVAGALRKLIELNATDARFKARLQLDRVGMFGHSYGGSHAFRALRDNPRIVAAANVDGSVYSRDFAAGVKKPFLTIVSGDFPSADGLAALRAQLIASNGLTAEQAAAVLARSASSRLAYLGSRPASFAAIPAARHLNFTDNGLWAAYGLPVDTTTINVPDARAILDLHNELLVRFFERYVSGSTRPLTLPATRLMGVTLEHRP